MSSWEAQTWQRLSSVYAHLTHHIIPGPNSISYFVPFILLPAALLIPPSTLSHRQLSLLFLPVIYGCQIHAWSKGGVDVISLDLTLWSFVLLFWRDPRRTHRRVWVAERAIDGKEMEQVEEEPYPVNLSSRIPWVLTLLVSLRLTGWRIGEISHDKMQPSKRVSRSKFVKVALSTTLQSCIILDASFSYVQTDPYFLDSKMSVDSPYPPPTQDMPTLLVMLRLLPPRLLRSSVLAAQIYAMVTSLFFLPTLPAVGLNVLGFLPDAWSPQTWPAFFGDFWEIGERGVRGLWGSWWHGMHKQITASHGRAVAERLGIPSGSTRGYALLVTLAFLFSGISHAGMIPPEPDSTIMSANMMRFYIASFFWAQIPAFGIELAASKVVARFVPHILHLSATRLFVFAWVAAWLCLTLPILTVPFREIGYWHHYAVPFSVLHGLAGKGWVTW